MKILDKIKHITYEKKFIYLILFSTYSNLMVVLVKLLLAYIYRNTGGGFFLISGVVNICVLLSKMLCNKSLKDPKNFKFYNFFIGFFIIIAGIAYAIYMGRLLMFDTMHIDFPTWLSITWSFLAFAEIIFGVRGLFVVRGKGHVFRNGQIINLGIALYAIVLAQVMLLSASINTKNANYYDAILGIVMGSVNVLLGVFIWFSPRLSLIDKLHNEYEATSNPIEDEDINIILVSSKIYGNNIYIAYNDGNIISGDIVREYKKIKNFKWYILIPFIIFIVVLIIPYLLGALVFYFYSSKAVSILNKKMEHLGYKKIKES